MVFVNKFPYVCWLVVGILHKYMYISELKLWDSIRLRMGIEDYHVLGLVGEGSFGKVYKGRKKSSFQVSITISLILFYLFLLLLWIYNLFGWKGWIVIFFFFLWTTIWFSDCCNEIHPQAWKDWEGPAQFEAGNWGKLFTWSVLTLCPWFVDM